VNILRLAILLSQRLEVYISGKTDEATEIWTREASTLIEASYGYELIQLIGRVSGRLAIAFSLELRRTMMHLTTVVTALDLLCSSRTISWLF
jgi:hypothetical protein